MTNNKSEFLGRRRRTVFCF